MLSGSLNVMLHVQTIKVNFPRKPLQFSGGKSMQIVRQGASGHGVQDISVLREVWLQEPVLPRWEVRCGPHFDLGFYTRHI
jgi:hypothetical protein